MRENVSRNVVHNTKVELRKDRTLFTCHLSSSYWLYSRIWSKQVQSHQGCIGGLQSTPRGFMDELLLIQSMAF
jgi:hypothetical protein